MLPTVPAEIQQKVNEVINQLLAKANVRFGREFQPPSVFYDVKNRDGGYHKNGQLHFNPILLLENVEHFLSTTVGHELAHYIQRQVYPQSLSKKGQRRRVHGWEWQTIMSLFGISANRCHCYDVSSIPIIRRRHERFPVYCKCKTYKVTKRIINRMQKGTTYKCRICKGRISLSPPNPLTPLTVELVSAQPA